MTAKRATLSPEGTAVVAALGELAKTLKSDIGAVVNPSADKEGHILKQDQLLQAARRAAQLASKIADMSKPTGVLDAPLNRELAQLNVMADSLAAAMTPVIEVAHRLPSTLEDFYLPLGPGLKEIEQGGGAIASAIERLEKHLG